MPCRLRRASRQSAEWLSSAHTTHLMDGAQSVVCDVACSHSLEKLVWRRNDDLVIGRMWSDFAPVIPTQIFATFQVYHQNSVHRVFTG